MENQRGARGNHVMAVYTVRMSRRCPTQVSASQSVLPIQTRAIHEECQSPWKSAVTKTTIPLTGSQVPGEHVVLTTTSQLLHRTQVICSMFLS